MKDKIGALPGDKRIKNCFFLYSDGLIPTYFEKVAEKVFGLSQPIW